MTMKSCHHLASFVPSTFVPSESRHANRALCKTARQPLNHRLRSTRVHITCSASTAQRTWLEQNDITLHPALNLSPLDARSNRGLTISNGTASPVSKGTTLVTLPETAWLTPATALKLLTSEYPQLTSVTKALSNESVLALFLLIEKSKGAQSAYAPLLSSFPRVGELDVTSTWTEAELQMLRGSPILAKTHDVQEGIRNEWEVLDAEIFSTDTQQWPSSSFSLDEYAWAVGIVDSRCVAIGSSQPLVLAPVLHQLTPCSAGEKPSAKLAAAGGALFSKKKVNVVLESDLGAGEEVTISFGPGLRNLDLLLERGLVVEGQDADCVEVTFSVTQMDRFYEDKSDILEGIGMETTCTFQLESADANGKWNAPEGLDAFLRLLCLGGGDLFLLEAVFRSDVWEFMQLPVSLENETMLCDLIIGACEDALEEYEWVFDEHDDGGPRRDMAQRLVESEKRILQETIDSYQRQLSSVDALEYYAERRLKALDLLRPVDESEIVDSESGGRISRAFDENY